LATPADEIVVRAVTAGDLPAINAIYNHYVRTSTCTFQVTPDSLEDTRRWFEAHGERHPILVAERGGEVVGWASLSAYHQRCAYRQTAENSVYVREDLRGQGLGTRLLAELIERARRLDYHSIMALICSEHAGSIALHQRFGYEQVGLLREVGDKFGRWLDVVLLQLHL
jgi:phosphinothricin acetyltransferase